MQPVIQEPRQLSDLIQPRNPWRTLAVLALMVMELSWVVLWSNLLISPDGRLSYLRTFLVFGFIMVSVFSVVSLLNFLDLNLYATRAIVFLLLLVSTIFGLGSLEKTYNLVSLSQLPVRIIASFTEGSLNPGELFVIFVTLFLCSRSIALTSKPVGSEIAASGFRTGILMFLGYALLRPVGQSGPHGGFYVFLFSGLLAMSLTRIASVGQFRGGQQIPYNWRWLGGIVISILVILGAAILVGRIADEGWLRIIITIFAWMGYVLTLLISPLLWLAIRGISWIFEILNLEALLEFLKDAYQNLQEVLKTALAALQSLLSGFRESSIFKIFTFLSNARYLLILVGTLMMIVFIAWMVRRFRFIQTELSADEYQSLLDQQDLLHLIIAALRRSLDRILDGFEKAFRLQEVRRLLAAARIRRIYSQLMRLSARLGSPRPPARTPIEFLAPLNRLFPNLKSELEEITFMYVKVRYGELPEPSDEIATVERAWQRIHMEGKGMMRAERRRAD